MVGLRLASQFDMDVRNLKIFVIVILSLLRNQANAASDWACVDRTGTVFMPVVEFAKNDKRVLLVGMEHYASKKFFEGANHVMETWISEGDLKTTILTELFTCTSSTAAIEPKAKLVSPQLISLSQSREGSIAIAQKITDKQLVSSSCLLDVDGKTLRPEYIVARNREACDATSTSGDACHWELKYPKSAKIEVRAGDLELDRLAPVAQVLASLSYSDFEVKDGDAGQRTRSGVHNLFMMEYRNAFLIKETTRALQTSGRVILPWGSGHVAGLTQLLKDEGFSETRSLPLRLGNPKDPGLSKQAIGRLESIAMNKNLLKANCQNQSTGVEVDTVSRRSVKAVR